MVTAGGMASAAGANNAHGARGSGRLGSRRKGHSRRTAHSAVADRKRQYTARQTRPNVAGLPRSAPLTAMEMAMRRRVDTSRKPVSPAAPSAPARRSNASVPLWRRLSGDTTQGVTAFRRRASGGSAGSSAALASHAQMHTQMMAPAFAHASPSVAMPARKIVTTGRRLRTGSHGHGSRVLVTLALLIAFVLALIPTPMLAYDNTMALAKSGVTHLKNAENDFKALATAPTNIATIDAAQSELQQAHNDFSQVELRVALLTPAEALPNSTGSKIAAANKLLPLAVQGTQAGVLACDAFKTLVAGLKDPLGANGGLTSADMDKIIYDVDQIHSLYGEMQPALLSLTPADLSLDPRLGPLVDQLKAKLPEATMLIDDLDGVAQSLPQLLGVGKPATYLVEVLDSSELRPTGGFIGNFGALTLNNGRLDQGFHISDVTLIDSSVKFNNAPHKQFIPIPSKYSWLNAVFVDPNGNSWSLRDSNLDPNYPTAAQYALDLYPRLLPNAQKNLAAQHSTLKLYDPAKSGQFAGVITLSLGIFEQALKITGPLAVPEFHQTVTSSNFVSLIHSYALGSKATGPDNKACGVTSCAKTFTSAVVSAFMTKVKSNLPLYVGSMGKLLYDSLKTKDLEVYLTEAPAQKALHDMNLSAEVAAPKTGDTVFEVDANVGANKDNYFLKYKMADNIVIDQSGTATHHLAWSYQWPNNPATLKETFAAGGPDYQSYSRVFTPPNAKLLSQRGLMNFGTGSEFGRRVFHGSVTDSYGRTSSYAMSWKVPGVVTHDSSGYHYQLTFQREAGIVWPLKLSITLPKCATVLGTPTTSGLTSQDAVTVAGDTVTITGPLTMDAHIDINYSCTAS